MCYNVNCFPRLEENKMKKITEARAIELINLGIYPKCITTSKYEDAVFVTSVSELFNLKKLGELGSQRFELFEVNQTLNIPDNASEVSFDQAYMLLDDNIPHLVYAVDYSNVPIEISTRNELISFRRSRDIRSIAYVFFTFN